MEYFNKLKLCMMYLKLSVFYVYGEMLLFSTELFFFQVISKLKDHHSNACMKFVSGFKWSSKAKMTIC